MKIKCKECKVKFEGTSNSIRCYDCRKISIKEKSVAYQKSYREKNPDKIKTLSSKNHPDHAHSSGYF